MVAVDLRGKYRVFSCAAVHMELAEVEPFAVALPAPGDLDDVAAGDSSDAGCLSVAFGRLSPRTTATGDEDWGFAQTLRFAFAPLASVPNS